MHPINLQIKAVEKASALMDNANRKELSKCLDSAAQTLVAFEKNEQAAERAVKRSKELEEAYNSITRLNDSDVCELAMEWLDMNNPDPDKVNEIAERMGMGWDESTEEYLDFDNISLKVSNRHKVYDLQARIFNLEEAGKNLIEAMNQYSFFAEGYRNGSASISEVKKASEDQHKAYVVMFDLTKHLNHANTRI